MATIIGTFNTDFLVGTADSDLVFTEAGNDVAVGNAGNDEIYGSEGNDLLLGQAGNDILRGGVGSDTLYGNEGNDSLNGDGLADVLYGDAGNDRLNGGGGADLLIGGAGRDVLTGGNGRDGFVLANGGGGSTLGAADVITDFQNGRDTLRLSGLTFADLSITQGTGSFARDTIIRNRRTGEYLAILKRVSSRLIDSRDVRSIVLPVRDITPPAIANLSAPNVTTAGGTTQTFTVQYADIGGLNPLSFDNADLVVAYPDGITSQLARVVGVNVPGSGTTATVTYQIAAPGGTWDANDNGTYSVFLLGGQVFDQSGNFAPTTAVGSFNVNVPIPIVPVTVAVAPGSTTEDSGTPMVFTLTRTDYIRNALTVSFNLGGTAVRGTDYNVLGGTINSNTGTVTFAPNVATATIRVTPIVDSTREANESVVLTLVPGAAYSLGTASSATGTLVDDDSEVSLSIDPTSVLEDSNGELVYTFTRTGASDRQITVNFTVGGTATFATDYTLVNDPNTTATLNATTGTLVFNAGDTTKVLRLKPTTDAAFEPDETIALTLANGTGYTRTTTNAVTGTILNDESRVAIAVAPGEVLEDGTTPLVYTLTRDGYLDSLLVVNFSVGGTASLGGGSGDYTVTSDSSSFTFGATSGTIAFAATETTKTITVTPTADSSEEPNETVILGITTGTGYVPGNTTEHPGSATGVLLNDEGSIALFVSPDSVAENSGSSMTYTFSRSDFLDRALTVNFTISGSASLNTDYTVSAPIGTTYTFDGTNGSITFSAGQTTRTLAIAPIGDAVQEPDETIALTLQDGTGYTSQTLEPVVSTIANDDATVSLAITTTSTVEDGGTGLVYTFTRSGFINGELTVKFSVGGTATYGADQDYFATSSSNLTFGATQGTITFAAGEATATLTLLPTFDLNVIEANETVELTLQTDPTYTVGTTTTLIGTILNDDGIVTNLNDSGAGSLRQAILAANNSESIANPTLTFSSTAGAGTINLSSALPDLSRDMIIDGPGASNVSIQGAGSHRLLTIANGVDVTVQDLTLTGGNAGSGNGGAILNTGGNLTLINSVLSSNQAEIGGAIYNQTGTLTLRNTAIANNTATAGGGIGIQGGIVNLQESSRIQDNTAQQIGGGITNNGTLNVTGSSGANIIFSGNQAVSAGGGALHNSGTATINYGDFVNNRASAFVGGGAIYNNGGSLSIGNSVFNGVPLNSPSNILGGYTNAGGNTPINP